MLFKQRFTHDVSINGYRQTVFAVRTLWISRGCLFIKLLATRSAHVSKRWLFTHRVPGYCMQLILLLEINGSDNTHMTTHQHIQLYLYHAPAASPCSAYTGNSWNQGTRNLLSLIVVVYFFDQNSRSRLPWFGFSTLTAAFTLSLQPDSCSSKQFPEPPPPPVDEAPS